MGFLSAIWKTLFFNPFLNLILLLYVLLGDNLGLAVIALAIITRIALIPNTKRQMAMTGKMSQLKPKLQKLQEKYKHNQEKLAKEQMKLYKEVGYNPIGCLGSFLPQILILAAIFGVIRTISEGNFDGLYGPVYSFVFDNGSDTLNNLHFLFWDLTSSYTSFTDTSLLAPERIPYLALGVLVGIVQFFSTMFMQKFQGAPVPVAPKKTSKDEPMSPEEMQAQMSKSMGAIFPLLTAYITLSQPAVLGIYWFAQSLMFIVQYFIIDRTKAVDATKELLERFKKKD